METSFHAGQKAATLVTRDGVFGIDKNYSKALVKDIVSDQTKQAQSIKLRYRIADSISSDSTPFKLGFKIFGNEIGVQLLKVDRAGSEGIVDITTVWLDETLRSGGSAAYENQISVPPVSLFCQ